MSKSFKSHISDLIETFNSLEGYQKSWNPYKLKIVKADREFAKFKFCIKLDMSSFKEEYKNPDKFFDVMEKKFISYCKGFSMIFDGETTDFNYNDFEARYVGDYGIYSEISTRVTFWNKDGDFDTYVQMGYNVRDLENIFIYGVVYFYGPKVKQENHFEVLPEIKKDTILVEYFGYNCSLCTFWKVKNRSGSTLALTKLNQAYASGDWMNGSVVPTEIEDREIVSKVIRNGNVKGNNGHYLHVWDRKPVYVNCD